MARQRLMRGDMGKRSAHSSRRAGFIDHLRRTTRRCPQQHRAPAGGSDFLRGRPLSRSTRRASPAPGSGGRAAACRREKPDNSSRQPRPAAPVRGLRPRRARLVLGVKVPNPRSSTRSPRASPAPISLKRTPTASRDVEPVDSWVRDSEPLYQFRSGHGGLAAVFSSAHTLEYETAQPGRRIRSGYSAARSGSPQRHLDRRAIEPARHQAILEFSFSCQFADQDDAGDRQYQDHDKTHQRGSLPRVLIPCAAFVHSALPPARPETVARILAPMRRLHQGASIGEHRRARRGLTAVIRARQRDPFRQ